MTETNTSELYEGGESLPERTCVVCRQGRDASELVRFGVEHGVAVPKQKGGRGAYVCALADCLTALEAKALSRAFSSSVRLPDDWLALVHQLAAQRVFELLGLARRQGVLTLGADHVKPHAEGLIVVASDVSERNRVGSAVVFGTADELGRAVGASRVGVMQVSPGRLGDQAAYWLRVWYESRPRGSTGQ